MIVSFAADSRLGGRGERDFVDIFVGVGMVLCVVDDLFACCCLFCSAWRKVRWNAMPDLPSPWE